MRGPRTLPLVLLGLLLGGLPSCARLTKYRQERAAADLRAQEMEKECVALQSRTIAIEEEYSLGSAVGVNWVSRGGGLLLPSTDEGLTQQLNLIGRNLAAQSSRPTLSWTFGVLRSPGINAVSGPGGYVFVSEGLLARLDNEAELAGVLAHEISHITARHALNEYQAYLVDECDKRVMAERTRARGTLVSGAAQDSSKQIGLFASTLSIGAVQDLFSAMADTAKTFDLDKESAQVFQALTNGLLSRLLDKGLPEKDEYAADREAVELMTAAGYDPNAYIAFLGKLPEQGLSTRHPRKDKRQAALRDQVEQLRQVAMKEDFTTGASPAEAKVVPLRGALLTHRDAASTPRSP